MQRFVSMMSGNDVNIVGPSMIQAHKTVAAMLEKMAITLGTVNRAVGDKLTNPYSRRPLAESRCVSSLKSLGSDKLEFKNPRTSPSFLRSRLTVCSSGRSRTS